MTARGDGPLLQYVTEFSKVSPALKDRTLWENIRNIADVLRKKAALAIKFRSDPDAVAQTHLSDDVTESDIRFEAGFLLEQFVPLGVLDGLIDPIERQAASLSLPWCLYASLPTVVQETVRLLREASSDGSVRMTSVIYEPEYANDPTLGPICRMRVKGYGGRWRAVIGDGAIRLPIDKTLRNVVAAIDAFLSDVDTVIRNVGGTGRQSPQGTPRPRITQEEANAEAFKLLKEEPSDGGLWTVRRLAGAIGCSNGTAVNLSAWKTYAKAKGVGRDRARKPKTVSLTTALEAMHGNADKMLEKLKAEQAEDDEVSPLSNSSRRFVRSRKGL